MIAFTNFGKEIVIIIIIILESITHWLFSFIFIFYLDGVNYESKTMRQDLMSSIVCQCQVMFFVYVGTYVCKYVMTPSSKHVSLVCCCILWLIEFVRVLSEVGGNTHSTALNSQYVNWISRLKSDLYKKSWYLTIRIK